MYPISKTAQATGADPMPALTDHRREAAPADRRRKAAPADPRRIQVRRRHKSKRAGTGKS